MGGRRPDLTREQDSPAPGESFLARFHRLKSEARTAPVTEPPRDPAADSETPLSARPSAEAEELQPTDADMPPVDSLGADSDYRGFLSPGVSDALRKVALRKLFHGASFNIIDELDDYAEDFTTFEALGDVITADMRHRLELEAQKKVEALEQALRDDVETPSDGEQPANPGHASTDPGPSDPKATADDPYPTKPPDPESGTPHA